MKILNLSKIYVRKSYILRYGLYCSLLLLISLSWAYNSFPIVHHTTSFLNNPALKVNIRGKNTYLCNIVGNKYLYI